LTRPHLLEGSALGNWLIAHPTWQLRDAHLVREVRTIDYPSSIELLMALVEPAERLDHHPVVTVGYCQLRFELWTHDRGGVTQLDLDYAEALDDLAVTTFARYIRVAG
jgi:4a-hydroxytetrahydrobiopterin dehydratase